MLIKGSKKANNMNGIMTYILLNKKLIDGIDMKTNHIIQNSIILNVKGSRISLKANERARTKTVIIFWAGSTLIKELSVFRCD